MVSSESLERSMFSLFQWHTLNEAEASQIVRSLWESSFCEVAAARTHGGVCGRASDMVTED